MKTQQSDFLAAEFLLGKLSEEETTRMEAEVFAENNQFELILIAENDLIDAYVKDELAPEDRVLFKNRLLLNPRQRQRVEFAKTLVKYASSQPVEEQKFSFSSSIKSNWLSTFEQFFSAKPLLSYSYSIAAVLFIATAAFWLALNYNAPHLPHDTELASAPAISEIETQNPLSDTGFEEQKYSAETNSKSETTENRLSAADERLPSSNLRQQQALPNRRIEQETKKVAPIISTIILSVASTRGGSAEPRTKAFDIPANAKYVNLRLNFEEGDFSSFYTVIETVEGQQIWSGKTFKSSKNKSEKTITLSVPARLLKKGDYIVTLKGLTKDGAYESVGDYSFGISR